MCGISFQSKLSSRRLSFPYEERANSLEFCGGERRGDVIKVYKVVCDVEKHRSIGLEGIPKII